MSVLAIAHRAGNTLAALHEANVLGADVIECDVHAYRGRLEVRHHKTAGPLPFLWDTWELVSATAPRLGLEELLEADRRGAVFMLDLKGRGEGVGRAVADLLHQRAREHPVLVCGRRWRAVDHVADALPYVRPVLSARTRPELWALRRRLAARPPGSAYGVSLHASLLRPAVVAEIRERVEVVMTWPVNSRPCLETVLGLGVSGVISDEPEVLAEVVRRRG